VFPLVRDMAAAGAHLRVPVTVACRVLGLSTAGYYKWVKNPFSQRDWDDAHATNALLDIHEDDPTLGYRFLADELGNVGIIAGENRVWRLCSDAGVFASHHRRRSKAGKPGPPAHDDLLALVDEKGRVYHEFTATAPDEVWLTDITEHATGEGKLYLCAVKDVFSNRIVGYSIDSRMQSSLAATAIGNAILARSPNGTICHSDRGSQFRSKKVIRLLKNNGLRGSMGRVASAGDNAAMESFFSLLQKNVLNTRRWQTREQLRLAIAVWIETKYNRRRRQRALGKLTPVDFETLYLAADAA
jgi:putative transposase